MQLHSLLKLSSIGPCPQTFSLGVTFQLTRVCTCLLWEKAPSLKIGSLCYQSWMMQKKLMRILSHFEECRDIEQAHGKLGSFEWFTTNWVLLRQVDTKGEAFSGLEFTTQHSFTPFFDSLCVPDLKWEWSGYKIQLCKMHFTEVLGVASCYIRYRYVYYW